MTFACSSSSNSSSFRYAVLYAKARALPHVLFNGRRGTIRASCPSRHRGRFAVDPCGGLPRARGIVIEFNLIKAQSQHADDDDDDEDDADSDGGAVPGFAKEAERRSLTDASALVTNDGWAT